MRRAKINRQRHRMLMESIQKETAEVDVLQGSNRRMH